MNNYNIFREFSLGLSLFLTNLTHTRMKTTNFTFTRLLYYALHYIVPILLSLTIIIAYQYINYTDFILLCDGGDDIYQLKYDLTEEVARYRKTLISYEKYTDHKSQLLSISRPNFRNFQAEAMLENKLEQLTLKLGDSLGKVRELEASIIKIEPTFKSIITNNRYLRVGKV